MPGLVGHAWLLVVLQDCHVRLDCNRIYITRKGYLGCFFNFILQESLSNVFKEKTLVIKSKNYIIRCFTLLFC